MFCLFVADNIRLPYVTGVKALVWLQGQLEPKAQIKPHSSLSLDSVSLFSVTSFLSVVRNRCQ